VQDELESRSRPLAEFLRKISETSAKQFVMTTVKKKNVFLIRHAESDENHRIATFQSTFAGKAPCSWSNIKTSLGLLNVPALLDSPLSPKGQRQVKHMGEILLCGTEGQNFVSNQSITLVIHSPLIRAKETCLGMLGHIAPSPAEEKNCTDDISSVRKDGGVAVIESPLLLEKTVSEWVLPSGVQALDDRIISFESWLSSQDEHDTIAIVGHSQYFKRMLEMKEKFNNCEVWKIEFDPNCSSKSESDSIPDKGSSNLFPRGWSNLTNIHRCEIE